MEPIQTLFFYLLDKTVRTHRQYSQNRLRLQGYPITVDQWLLLTAISQNKSLTQAELCEIVFKDKASLARMMDVLLRKKLLKRKSSKEDKRKWQVDLTAKGEALLAETEPIVLINRKLSLEGVSNADLEHVKQVVYKILDNCHRHYNL